MKRDSRSRAKRRERIRRRRESGCWGKTPRNWFVTLVLGGKSLSVDERANTPEEAVISAIEDNRQYVVGNVKGNSVRAIVKHEHIGVVEDRAFSIPPERSDAEEDAKPKKEYKKASNPRDVAIRMAARGVLLDRRERELKRMMKEEHDIAAHLLENPKFASETHDGLPGFVFDEEG